ncbi:MAG: GDP-mannose 4,6-dehydratase [Alphaproteobacteria bacterium]
MVKRALVTGVSGQDGAYLARRLLDDGFEVHGALRRGSSRNLWRLEELGIAHRVRLEQMELLEFSNIVEVLRRIRPHVVYNLAAQSFVGTSFQQPVFTGDVTGLGAVRVLEAIRLVDPEIRFYQASTSEMFGNADETPQNEHTPFHPCSPYGTAKLYAHWSTVTYREAHGLHASTGILFNHESPLRGAEFVTRKITCSFALRKHGLKRKLELGNLNAERDWGHARDYVDGIHAIAMHDRPDDFVLATGSGASVRRFVALAAEAAGLALEWEGEGLEERAVDPASGETVVCVNPEYYRPAEVHRLIGDAAKARQHLGWEPKVTLEEMAEEMVRADFDRIALSGRVA